MVRRTVFAAALGLCGLCGPAFAAPLPVPAEIDRIAALCRTAPDRCLLEVRTFLRTLKGFEPLERDRMLARLVNQLVPLANGDARTRATLSETLDLAARVAASWQVSQQIRQMAMLAFPDPLATGAVGAAVTANPLPPALPPLAPSQPESGSLVAALPAPPSDVPAALPSASSPRIGRTASLGEINPDARVEDTPVVLPPGFLFPPRTEASSIIEPAVVDEEDYFPSALRPMLIAPMVFFPDMMPVDPETGELPDMAMISSKPFGFEQPEGIELPFEPGLFSEEGLWSMVVTVAPETEATLVPSSLDELVAPDPATGDPEALDGALAPAPDLPADDAPTPETSTSIETPEAVASPDPAMLPEPEPGDGTSAGGQGESPAPDAAGTATETPDEVVAVDRDGGVEDAPSADALADGSDESPNPGPSESP